MNQLYENDNEVIVDGPSQLLNLGYLLATVALVSFSPILAGLCLIVLIWKSLETQCTSWYYSQNSIVEKKGVFNVTIDEIQLFRIKDLRLHQPLLYRLVGLSRLTLLTSDAYKPVIVLKGIRNGHEKRAMFKELILSSRDDHDVREFDIR